MSTIPIANIAIHTRLRKLQPESVLSLSASIQEIGLLQPITVAPMPESTDQTEPQYTLIAGLHRLEAYKMLGKTEIPATVITATMAEQQLMEIDENLERAELTCLERAEHLSERKRLYEEIHPETRHGGTPGAVGIACGGKASKDVKNTFLPPSFSKATAQRLNCSESTVQKAVHRATHITPETKEIIRDMPAIANNSVELDVLASLPPVEQKAAVQAVKSGEAKNIRQATGTPTRWHKAKSANADAQNDAVFQPSQAERLPVPEQVVLPKADFINASIDGRPFDWEMQCRHLDSLVTKQKMDIRVLMDQIKSLKKENQGLKKELAQIKRMQS